MYAGIVALLMAQAKFVMLQLQLQSQGSLQGCIPFKLKWLDDLLCSIYSVSKLRRNVSEVFTGIIKIGECIKSGEGV